jgi:hypothetical protein
MNPDGSGFPPRAQRFTLPSSILYRPVGEFRWRDGRAQNISRSGVLFHGREPMELEMPVEILMEVPAEVMGPAAGASLGRGRIVRLGTERSNTRPGFAAAITDWKALPVDPRRL